MAIRQWHTLLCMCSVMLVTSASAAPLETKRAFTVDDAFEQAQLYDVLPRRDPRSGRPFLFSADGRRVFFIVGRGDAKLKTYHFNLITYNIDDIRRFANGHLGRTPSSKVVLSVDDPRKTIWDNVRSSAGIKNVTEIAQDKLLMLATDQKGIHQVFIADIASGDVRKLTSEKSRVLDYVYLNGQDKILYTTPDTSSRSTHCKKRTGFPVRDMTLYDAICFRDGSSFYEVRQRGDPDPGFAVLHSLSLSSGAKAVEVASGISLDGQLSDIVLSPQGDRAILRLRAKQPPAEFAEAFFASRTYKESLARFPGVDQDVVKPRTRYRYYGILDFENGRLRALHEFLPTEMPPEAAPDRLRGNGQPAWLSESQLFLPAVEKLGDGVGGFNIQITAYGYEATSATRPSGQQARNLTALADDGSTQRCIDFPVRQGMPQDGLPLCYIERPASNVRLVLDQSADRPPTVIAEDTKTGAKRALFRLNPQFDRFTFGSVEVLRWSDKDGQEWTAGLVLPPNYRPGHRYPLVIQPSYFFPDHFLVDGPPIDAPPYAAQALANKGIIVLQVGIAYKGGYDRSRAELIANLEKAIEALNQRNLIDLDRIGMTGFSAMGRLTFTMALYSKYALAAVIISDSASPTITGYTFAHGLEYPGMLDVEWAMCDTKPWGSGIRRWVSQNPFFHLDSLKSAVLITTSEAFITDWWDAYAGMRRLKKPVELYFHTSGGHPILRADSALADYQLTIDWYDFWLNDRESDDPEKAEQYKYWRELRRRKRVAEAGSPPAPSLNLLRCSKEPH